MYSDSADDPHSPIQQGTFKLFLGQLESYKRVLRRLIDGTGIESEMVADLDFEVNWLNRNGLWYLPYVLHGLVALALALLIPGGYLIGLGYFAGMMSHPIQGWLVNAFAHSYGYQTFRTGDNSRNNTLIALLVVGEGYQNNHHARPSSAKFSYKGTEFDAGYAMCLAAESLGLINIRRAGLFRRS